MKCRSCQGAVPPCRFAIARIGAVVLVALAFVVLWCGTTFVEASESEFGESFLNDDHLAVSKAMSSLTSSSSSFTDPASTTINPPVLSSTTPSATASASPLSSSSFDSGNSTGLVWAILMDLSRTSMSVSSLSEAVTAFLTNSSASHTYLHRLFRPSPIIVDTHGSMLTALTEMTALLNDVAKYPSVLFLAETADVSASVMDLLRQYDKDSNILVISAHSSNSRLCEPATNPRTMCMVPRDMINLRGLLEVVSNQLQWYSMGVTFSNDGYGDGVQTILSGQVQAASTTPTIVAQSYINSAASDSEDDDVIRQMTEFRARGVACFVKESEMLRLRQAVLRNKRAANTVFLIGSREGLNVLSNLTGDVSTAAKPWGALFVSGYTTPDELVAQGFFPHSQMSEIDEYGAFVLSYLLDGLLMIDAAQGAVDNMTALRAVRFAGYSGTVAFDPIYYQRVESVFSLVTASHPISNPLVTWTLHNYSSAARQVNVNATTTAALVKTSPLRTVKLCMTAAPGCASVQMAMSMMYVLQAYNAQVEHDDGDDVFNFYPVAVNTGSSGVAGLASLIPIARTCTVLSGPGSDSIAMAFTPVVNEFNVPQIDYAVSNDYFTDNRYTYPYFSRSIPKDTFQDGAIVQICVHYGWERVILISLGDQYGISRAATMMSAMRMRNLFVERSFSLHNASEAALREVMESIYATLVSRIIVLLVPFTTAQAEALFKLSDSLTYMRKYIFFLDGPLCHMAASTQTGTLLRRKLPSSICVFPFVPEARLNALNAEYQSSAKAATLKSMMRIMSDGGFVSSIVSCNTSAITPFSGFAVDAGYVLIDAVKRAVKRNVSIEVASRLLPYIRNTSIDRFTGNCTLDATGNRLWAAYSINIQLWDADPLTIGMWNSRNSTALSITETSFMWLTNSTEAPLDTFRDSSFVLSSAFSASPGTIVISALGFVITIAVFYLFYRHYRLQKLIEQALESNLLPITDEELRRLRGIKEDV
ncbi:putative extracellular receptor [Leptomonas seymouri]|uniref:Putative extracellular receptor n=1 Tax=Leptomonas seymouri TaxID=5684 RepID=A0A0N1IMK8_LEPSE|nr:putative extracellular receptor [Leptomonas seymouri]|eukprot:KPI90084.1 putative extracellular receptor [Leptomonas seymouri]